MIHFSLSHLMMGHIFEFYCDADTDTLYVFAVCRLYDGVA